MTYFSDKVYQKLKFLTQIVLPAIATLYFALAGIWGLPAAEQIVGTIVAVDTFLGVVLQLSTSAYNNSNERFDGVVHVSSENEDGLHEVRIAGLPSEAKDIIHKDELVLKVQNDGGS